MERSGSYQYVGQQDLTEVSWNNTRENITARSVSMVSQELVSVDPPKYEDVGDEGILELPSPTVRYPTDERIPLQKQESKIKRGLTFCKHLRVEPLALVIAVINSILYLVTQNFLLQQVCLVNLGYGRFCERLFPAPVPGKTNLPEWEEKKVQRVATDILQWKSVIENSIPVLITVFFGPWTDILGRKLCIILPVIGTSLSALFLLITAFFDVTGEGVALATAIPTSLTGSLFLLRMASFSLVSDVTSIRERSLRIGIMNTCFTLGASMGISIGAPLLQAVGYKWVFGICCILSSIFIIYAVIFIRDEIKPTEDMGTWFSGRCLNRKIFERGATMLRDIAATTFRKREGNQRVKMILMIINVGLGFAPPIGELSVLYMYTRNQYHWDAITYSHYFSLRLAIGMVGNFLVLAVFVNRLNVRDAVIGLVASLLQIGSSFLYAFSSQQWMMYVAPAVNLANGSVVFTARAVISSIAQTVEMGKINTFISCVEAMAPLIAAPLYTLLYEETLLYFPGAFFLLSASLGIPAYFIFLYIFIDQKRHELDQVNQLKRTIDPESTSVNGEVDPSESDGNTSSDDNELT